jgi:hypothetical protein
MSVCVCVCVCVVGLSQALVTVAPVCSNLFDLKGITATVFTLSSEKTERKMQMSKGREERKD